MEAIGLDHVKHLAQTSHGLPVDFEERVTGRFYTHEAIARHLITALLRSGKRSLTTKSTLTVCDPFAGDGRLIKWLLDQWIGAKLPQPRWRLLLLDLHEEGLRAAEVDLHTFCADENVDAELDVIAGDSFVIAPDRFREQCDIVITNPPWELLKPDSRELSELSADVRESYIASMREYDQNLADRFPASQPLKKFAGWGTNLSRVGLDLSRSLARRDGFVAIVLPASFLADGQSVTLRESILCEMNLLDVAYFPAEACLFNGADVATSTLVFKKRRSRKLAPMLTMYDHALAQRSRRRVSIADSFLRESGFVLPVSVGTEAMALQSRIASSMPRWGTLEGPAPNALWAGREIDETRSREWLTSVGDGPPFIKGRMIDRYQIREQPQLHVSKPGWRTPRSVKFDRIAWRDVSRPNQKRRLIASLIPAGWTAGNSLGVAHFNDANPKALRALLGVMNSVCFEFQLRSHLATGHVSLSSLRKVPCPSREGLNEMVRLAATVDQALAGDATAESRVEALVARDVYGLSRCELEMVLSLFAKVTAPERDEILAAYGAIETSVQVPEAQSTEVRLRIPNHICARLSALDMEMVLAVPPGGNWKNIPESIPSKRLEQIRVSFKAGEGSRSTYYGRLRSEMPAYTINTYFNRPGNGCHIHYEQDRVLSQREAARLQSFPDVSEFAGPQRSVNNQIGNAVPPLLAYQIAITLGVPGSFVDLFAGAGGLGLGFKMAGWTPVVANDIEPRFLETYAANVHDSVIVGSIADAVTFERVVEAARAARRRSPGSPFWILGGPPCQGFSTAGKRRSMDDQRNHLFYHYVRFLREIQPDGFVFENVSGLLNMDGGRVFRMVREAFGDVMPKLQGWLLNADEYAIPQRRKRVILVGVHDSDVNVDAPVPVTSCHAERGDLFATVQPAITVEEALSDLPPLESGEDGSMLDYASPPTTTYQAFVRGMLSPREYLERIRTGLRHFNPENSAVNKRLPPSDRTKRFSQVQDRTRREHTGHCPMPR